MGIPGLEQVDQCQLGSMEEHRPPELRNEGIVMAKYDDRDHAIRLCGFPNTINVVALLLHRTAPSEGNPMGPQSFNEIHRLPDIEGIFDYGTGKHLLDTIVDVLEPI
jgi:hypothetical protein